MAPMEEYTENDFIEEPPNRAENDHGTHPDPPETKTDGKQRIPVHNGA